MPSPRNAAIVDTGFIVSLFNQREPAHAAAITWLATNKAALISIQGVITEACFFLRSKGRAALLEWVARGGLQIIELPQKAYGKIIHFIQRYADQDPDFVDCALIWLADELACRRILTLDYADFEIYRLAGNKRFELVDWVRK